MRRALLIVLTIAALAVMVPLSVVATAWLGLGSRHWSGTELVDVELPVSRTGGASPPDAAIGLLDQARRQDESDTGELAPSWWDPDAEEVVLGAVTPRGEQIRRGLVEGQSASYRIERRPHSSRYLQHVMDDVIGLPEDGVFMSFVEPEHNRVNVGATRISHGLFSTLDARYGGAAGVIFAPFEPPAGIAELSADQPSQRSRADPVGSWFTLATGFPWHLAAWAVITGAVWALPFWRRRRREGAVAATSRADDGTVG